MTKSAYANETNPALAFRQDVNLFLHASGEYDVADAVAYWDTAEATEYAEAHGWDARACAHEQIVAAEEDYAERQLESLYSPYTPQADRREAEFEMSRFTDDC